MSKISVLMSVYNSEIYVDKSIESILNQTHSDFEFLIINDGSTDNTEEIIKNYANLDERIDYVTNKRNEGLTKSLNKLLDKSKNSIIARQDADDISDKRRFQYQLNFLKKYSLDGCTTLASSLQTNKPVHKYKSMINPKLVINYKNPFIHGSLMLKKHTVEEIGGYAENFKYAQDYKLMTDLLNNNFKIKILKKLLYKLNTQNNISSINKEEQEYYANCVRKSINPKY